MSKNIFISYNEENMAIANGIAQFIGEDKCFVAHNDVQLISDNLMSETDQRFEAIHQAKYLIFILSKHTANSKTNLYEIKQAVDSNTTIITFKIEDIEPSKELEPYLNKDLWFNTLEGSTFEHMQKLEKIVSN